MAPGNLPMVLDLFIVLVSIGLAYWTIRRDLRFSISSLLLIRQALTTARPKVLQHIQTELMVRHR